MSHTSELNTELDTSHFVGSIHMILNKTCGSLKKIYSFCFLDTLQHLSWVLFSPEMISVISVPNAGPFFCEVLSTLAWIVHVGKFLKAWSPVIEVVVVLVSVWAAWSNRAEAACQWAFSLKVVDQGCVVWRHIGIVVCRLQALTREKLQGDLAEWGWNKCLDVLFKLQMIITCLWTCGKCKNKNLLHGCITTSEN